MTEPRAPIGVLLINLGTPDSPRVADVRRYLRQFLSDPRVIDLPSVLRWLLLHLVILPFRPRRTARAYAQIWTDAGSPLLTHGRALCAAVTTTLGPDFRVELGMRYGTPSIPDALGRLREAGVREVRALALFPQYSDAATGSAWAEVREHAGIDTPVYLIEPFYDDPGFIDSFAQVARDALDGFDFEHLVMSHHGLPARQLRRADANGHCLESDTCCEAMTSINRSCYRAQCFSTSRALATALGVASDRTSVCFQSRMGREEWTQPYTDEVLKQLAARGVKRVALACPAFVADCLETLEEIGVRGAARWRELGGDELRLLPCPNASPAWVAAVADLVRAPIKTPR